jgi:hypothetical protein
MCGMPFNAIGCARGAGSRDVMYFFGWRSCSSLADVADYRDRAVGGVLRWSQGLETAGGGGCASA